MPDRVSIRDLAKLAGVSVATVSLALRDSHVVAPATRKKIRDLARRHNYRSHPAVNTLMQQVRSGRRIHDEEVIAFVRSGLDDQEHASGPLELLAGAEEEAYRLGYRVEVFWGGARGAKSVQLARILYHRGIRGVIWAPMPYPHPPIVFPWEHFVPLACTTSTDVPNLPIVCIHHTKGMALMIGELTARGARRIGVVVSRDEDFRQDYGWITGIDLYRNRGGKTFVVPLILKDLPVEKNIRSWIRRHRLDALILTEYLYNCFDFLEGEIARASLDIPTPRLGLVAGLYQDMHRIGQQAIRSLSIRLANGILGLPDHSFSLVTQATFQDGASLEPLQRLARK